jgi:hypothetical protein
MKEHAFISYFLCRLQSPPKYTSSLTHLFQLKDGELNEVLLSKAIGSDLDQREKQVTKNNTKSFISDCGAKGKDTFQIFLFA